MVETPLAERPRARCCADGDVPGSGLPATAVSPACGSQACPPVAASNRSFPHRSACRVVQGPRVGVVGRRCAPGVSGRDRRAHAWSQWRVIGAHSGPDQSVGAPLRAGPVRRRFFSQGIRDDCVLTDRLGQQCLASGSVAFQRVQSLGIRSSHPTKRAAPSRAIAVTMRAAQRRDRQAGIGVTQEADALFCATPFFPVQSPSVATLDAKSTGDATSG